MKLLFWICFALTAYAYCGYAVLLWLWSLIHKRPVMKHPATPFVSIIMAVCNEEFNLPAKLADLQKLDYPRDKLRIIIASDGSTDKTPFILAEHAAIVNFIILDKQQGKAFALNTAVRQATGELLVFMDARQSVDANAITQLTSCFSDPSIGAVSGELVLESHLDSPSQDAVGMYWKIEKLIRRLESASGSVVGVTGALYAIRRELYTDIPMGTILDDVFVPMHIARQGKRVIFEASAIARDRVFSDKGKEFSRKVRTLTGNYQLLQLAPWILSFSNPLLFRCISHKLLRLIVPLLLIFMLGASGMAHGLFYRCLFFVQLFFYTLSVLGAWKPFTTNAKPVAIASTFVMLNAAAAIAFYNFISGRNSVWSR